MGAQDPRGGGWTSNRSLRVELVLRPRLLEGRQLRARGIDGDDLGKPLERYLQTARVVDLRHETEVGEGDLAAEGVRRGLHQRLQRIEAFDDPMVIPGIDLALVLSELVLEMAQRSDIVEGM